MAMQAASVGPKALVIGGFIIAFYGLFWLLSLRNVEFGFVDRLGRACAMLAAMGVVVYSWAVLAADIVRKRSWSAKACGAAGLTLMVPLVIAGLMFHREEAIISLLNVSFWSGFLCRRIVHPNEGAEGPFASTRFLSLFPK
jgi:hypothetical protein